MKSLVCCVILLLICVLTHVASDRTVPSDGKAREPFGQICGTLTYHDDGSVSAVGCPLMSCQPGKQIGYKEMDNSKPFPECCDGPICED